MSMSIQSSSATLTVSTVRNLQPTQTMGNRANGTDADGDDGGGFSSAINQALSQTGSSPNATGTADAQQALASFMQNLFAALQAQGQNSITSQTQAASGVQKTDGDGIQRHHPHGGGSIQSSLQSLIQQLSQSSSSPSASNSSDSALQQSFQNLLNATGGSGSQADLASFLQALSQNVQGMGPSGNVVSTRA